MTEHIYYCKKQGEPDYTEQIAVIRNYPLATPDFDKLVSAMAKDGYVFTHKAEYNGEAPRFGANVLNI